MNGEYFSITVNQSTFIYNFANTNQGGGAIKFDGECIFISNSACYCGALSTDMSETSALLTVPFTITEQLVSSVLVEEQPVLIMLQLQSPTGHLGAKFVGHIGSDVMIERSNILRNHAADWGGTITVFGSSITVYYGTNVYDNTANIGHTISACSSQIYLPIVAVRRPDPTFFSCVAYDNDIRFSIPTFQELQSYQKVTLLVNDLLRDNDLFANPMVKVKGKLTVNSFSP